ncbi:unnamed protein product [Zymoseptoria tritici ST99CH_1E4]|uniref:DUF4470 domain-containing protein n=1 Tax=Zymoseptoria tritici ST99CH_1E4 TaxID=1276532 RepID=A0A2H1H5L4_ZYMTR|nr:unnamed protein product [Zymoseptoria tritici ST99CH_1E4]
MKLNWQPDWIKEHRAPNFAHPPLHKDKDGITHEGYRWGSIPALDLINLPAHEGVDYKGDIRILSATSEDMGSIVKSIASLPEAYTGHTTFDINEFHFEVLARNILTTLVALTTSNEAQSVHCILHVWYSAFITQNDRDIITKNVLPIIAEVANEVKHTYGEKETDTILTKTWTFASTSGPHDVIIELTHGQWVRLHSFLEQPQVPPGVPNEQRKDKCDLQIWQDLRRAFTYSDTRPDARHRRLFGLAPTLRVCMDRFMADGLLLPFGANRDEFVIPNPTFFDTPWWPFVEMADPITGWRMSDIINTPFAAGNDIYGKTHDHIQGWLLKFHRRLRSHRISFRFTCLTPDLLTQYDKATELFESFSRIDTGHTADNFLMQDLQIETLIAVFGPLLQSPTENPHATLITLHRIAVDLMAGQGRLPGQDVKDKVYAAEICKPEPPEDCSPLVLRHDARYETTSHSFRHARPDMDVWFNEFLKVHEFAKAGKTTGLATVGMKMKKKHTIVEKWPTKMKLKLGQLGVKQELKLLRASGLRVDERYVEWKRT